MLVLTMSAYYTLQGTWSDVSSPPPTETSNMESPPMCQGEGDDENKHLFVFNFRGKSNTWRQSE